MTRERWILVSVLVLGGVLGYFALGPGRARGPVPTMEQIQALAAERDRLGGELQALLADHAGLDVKGALPANVLVGVPTSFARDLVNQMVTGPFSEVRLHLTGIETTAEGEVTVPLGGNIGRYSVLVNVKEIKAVLKPGQSEIQFGADRIGFRVPVTLAMGEGTAAIDVRWQGRGMAAVCGNLDFSTVISSGVQPATHNVAGELQVAVVDETLVAGASLEPMTTRVVLQPTDQTWAALESAMGEIRRDLSTMCVAAINRLNTRRIVESAIDRGFPVNVPAQVIENVTIPARVETSIALPGRTVTLEARPMDVRVTGEMLWYGVTLGASTAAPP